MIGAMRAGWDEILGIEQDIESVETSRARIAAWSTLPKGSTKEALKVARKRKPKAA